MAVQFGLAFLVAGLTGVDAPGGGALEPAPPAAGGCFAWQLVEVVEADFGNAGRGEQGAAVAVVWRRGTLFWGIWWIRVSLGCALGTERLGRKRPRRGVRGFRTRMRPALGRCQVTVRVVGVGHARYATVLPSASSEKPPIQTAISLATLGR